MILRSSSLPLHAFSLVELLTVTAVISILAGLSLPAVKGLSGANRLNTGARQFADWMTLARSEAIARHTRVRFAVAREWDRRGEVESGRLRRISLWSWNAEAERYLPLTEWKSLPESVVVEPLRPGYVDAASYAKGDASTVAGDCVLADEFEEAEFADERGDTRVVARFVEFLPNGSLRIPGSSARQAIFVATQGVADAQGTLTYTGTRANGTPAAWAQINVDALTGRVRVYRP